MLVFLVAGTIKGTFGIGLPIAAIGLMSQFIEPRLAVTLVVMPIIVSNAWQIFRAGDVVRAVRQYWPLGAVTMVVMFVTANASSAVNPATLLIVIGATVILFSLMNLMFRIPAIPHRWDTFAQWIAGIGSGVIGGLTAIWSPPVAAYLIATGADKNEFVRVTGLIFFVGSLPLLAGFLNSGVMTPGLIGWSSLMILPTILGFTLGERIRAQLNTARFRTAILLLFLLLGANLIRKAILGQ
ncbi:MAG: sulfite exporter TauE/SafE family protein [Pseudomonadota bacterium]